MNIVFFYEHQFPQVQLHKFMINLWFGNFLKIPQFIGVWGGIAVELGGTVCLLLNGRPLSGGKRGMGLKKTETDLNGRPLSEVGKKEDGVCGMTEPDLNGRLLTGGRGRVKWDDRDGPKWPAPAKGKRGRVKWDDRDGPKWPASARVKGVVGWEDRNGPKWPAPARGKKEGKLG